MIISIMLSNLYNELYSNFIQNTVIISCLQNKANNEVYLYMYEYVNNKRYVHIS